MLVILPFHSGDQQEAATLAHWIADLGTVQNHQCLIIHDKLADPDAAREIQSTLQGAFRHVVLMPLRESAPGIKGENLIFRRALRQVQASSAGPFLWLNPDAIPLREGWMDAIEAGWKLLPRGKHFLGCHLPGSTPHMAAVGVYPQDAEVHAPNLVMADANPFALNAAPQVVPKMAHTDLIVDARQGPFGDDGGALQSNAVIWHGFSGCKDGSLIDLLRILDREKLAALPISEAANPVNENVTNGSKFAVPAKPLPLKEDRSAQKAISRAGSEGIPAEEIDTSPQVPAVKPPTVTPVKAKSTVAVAGQAATAVALSSAARNVEAATPKLPDAKPNPEQPKVLAENLCTMITAENVDAFAAALAGYRDKDAAAKVQVLAALREHGFHIAGKSKAVPAATPARRARG